MSLLRNIGTIIVQSGKAVGNSVELLAEVAEQAEKASRLLLVRTRLNSLESLLRRQLEIGDTHRALIETHNQLTNLYGQLKSELTSQDRADCEHRYATLRWEIGVVELQEAEQIVRFLQTSMNGTEYELPVKKMAALQGLRSAMTRLINLRIQLGDIAASSPVEEIVVIDAELASLQKKREKVVSESYKNGTSLFRYRKYDGLLDGAIESWYPNGERALIYEYANGIFQSGKYWNADSSLGYEISMNSGELDFLAFIPSGQVVLKANIANGMSYLSIWMWDGYRVREAKTPIASKPTLRFMLPILLKPGFWYRLFQASRDIVAKKHFTEMMQSAGRFEQGLEQISTLNDLNIRAQGYQEAMAPLIIHGSLPKKASISENIS